MLPAKNKVTRLAAIIGIDQIRKPYANQQAIPQVNMTYIDNEISFVCFSLMVFMAWGTNAKVVSSAAKYPIISISILI